MRLALVGGAVAVGAIAARALVRRMTGQASNSAKLRLRLRGGGGDTEMLKKASLVCPWGGWLALKLSKSRPPTAPVSTPFKVSMTILAVYFGAVALASEFLPNFILGETVEPIEDNTPWAWSYLVATNFTETIAVLAFLAVQQPTVPTIAVEAVMFMLMYNMRNTFVNFFGWGAPQGGSYLSLVDGSIIWPIAACTFYQYCKHC